jgi:hypothetical protein
VRESLAIHSVRVSVHPSVWMMIFLVLSVYQDIVWSCGCLSFFVMTLISVPVRTKILCVTTFKLGLSVEDDFFGLVSVMMCFTFLFGLRGLLSFYSYRRDRLAYCSLL